MRSTHTYAVLDVSAATFADVRTRLADVLKEYLQESEEGPVIVFGTVALKAEAGQNELLLREPAGVELVEVPVYDSPHLTEPSRALLKLAPWDRVKGGRRTVRDEINGILIGLTCIVASWMQAGGAEGESIELTQANAEIQNLILLCGGKIKKPEQPASNEGGQAV